MASTSTFDAVDSKRSFDPTTFRLVGTVHAMYATERHSRDIRSSITAALLDEVEEAIVAMPLALQYVRNALSPINAIPVELLAYIFKMVVEPAQAFPHSYAAYPDPIDGLHVSQVCRHWRNVAFAFPDLWSTVDTARPMSVNAMLHRARGAPLKVIMRDRVDEDCIVPCLRDTAVLMDIVDESHRIEELHVEPKFAYGSLLIERFNQPAPNLRALTMHSVQGPISNAFLPKLFDGCTPRLERLTLGGFAYWRGNSFANLTHLCLHDHAPESRRPLSSMLQLLESCSGLQELALVAADLNLEVERDLSLYNTLLTPVVLPCLRTLDIGHSFLPQATARLLSHLILPPYTALNIWAPASSHFFGKNNGARLANLIPDDIIKLGPLRTLHTVRILDHKHAERYAGVEKLGDKTMDVLSVHDGVLHLISDFWSQDVLEGLLKKLHAQDIREITLAVDAGEFLSADAWTRVLKRTDGLTKLTVLPRCSGALFALRVPGICPELSELTVQEERRCTGFLLESVVSQRVNDERPLDRLRVLEGISASRGSPQLDDYAGRQLRECVRSLEYKITEFEEKELALTAWPSDAYRWNLTARVGK
ncbi:uncharacterized protein B0H18DRAFT_953824 [Fomitopsis serialis]|uniref:uncharacterized protein n=1 Tax=Fomitopsis serialis TaxID=139415 RepID=UPI0020086B33|nr:uncharacterized protein B0H18DRAFT_953824 [Neoantrodia serialis]KAH9928930.1 hypothetical protein B0H18DRAFT_953824 [Neoantrodia serialis]